MNRRETEYVKFDTSDVKVFRLEILFTPIFIVLPVVVAALFLYDWFVRGFSMGSSAFDGELMLAGIILVGNIMFDIPFIKSIKRISRRR